MQRRITTLSALLGAVRAGEADEAARAASAAAGALRADGELRLFVDGGVLRAHDGALPGADCFAAAQRIAGALSAANVPELAFASDAAAEALQAWAAIVVAAADRGCVPGDVAWPPGVSAPVRAAAPSPRLERSGPAADAHLRSVFLQHELINRLPALPGIAPPAAKFVVQLVVDRLLAVPLALEPLTMLQQDERALARGTAAAVLAVLFARAAGWPDEHLADIGAAALLHDVGTVLDPARPGPAAFTWLLARGVSDFWLRCALVARHANASDGDELAVVAVVRTALAVAAALHADPGAGADAVARAVRAASRSQPELIAVVPHVLGA